MEKINDGYLRFISGQYKLKLDEVEDQSVEKIDFTKNEICDEFNSLVLNFNMLKSIDDTGINYHSNYYKIPGNKGIHLDGDHLREFI